MERLKRYLLTNFEQVLVLTILVSVALINYYIPQKIAFINFYFLPVIVTGYFLGVRRSVLGAVLCILLVITYSIIYPHLFMIPNTRLNLTLYIIAWGGFLILAGAVVGKQHEKLQLKIQQAHELNEELLASNRHLRNARAASIFGFAKLAEYRDEDTGAHLERIREYARIIAEELARNPAYKERITQEFIEDIYLSSILHDIGKVGIEDSILLKPGKLTPEEFEHIKLHSTLGGDALKAAEDKMEGQSFLSLGREIAYCHHEKWDGSGYPKGLKGEEIPLSARIVALADVYDAITSDRPYKRAFTHEKSVEIILNDRGTHFDPDVVDAFYARRSDFNMIRIKSQAGRPLREDDEPRKPQDHSDEFDPRVLAYLEAVGAKNSKSLH
ncbi:MAG: HD-GYP domain-containing protein [bacterium]